MLKEGRRYWWLSELSFVTVEVQLVQEVGEVTFNRQVQVNGSVTCDMAGKVECCDT